MVVKELRGMESQEEEEKRRDFYAEKASLTGDKDGTGIQ